MTIYLTVTLIMLLNFLIAIFSDTYVRLTQRKRGLYMQEVIRLRKRYEFHPLYSSIVYCSIPLNLFFTWIPPIVSACRSVKVNNLILHFEYLPVAATGIIVHFGFVVLFSPLTFLLTSWMKFKLIFDKPVYSKTDRCARILDFMIFVFFGPIILTIYCFVDSYKFITKLYSKRVMTTHHERGSKMRINQHMVGKNEEDPSHGTSITLASLQSRRAKANRITNGSRKINPVKQGLSEDTLRIIKVVLGIVLRQLHHYADENKLSRARNFYLPTSKIVKTLSIHLLIPEQINAILLGPTYVKNHDYFSSKHYDALLDEIEMFNMMSSNNDGLNSIKYYQSFAIIRKKSQIDAQRSSNRSYDVPFTREKFDNHMRHYLLHSDESWILMQYNLCKTFLIHNSIEKPKSEAIDLNIEELSEFYGGIHKNQENEGRKSMNGDAKAKKDEIIKVIDINALFRIIKEIEKRVRIRTEQGDLVSANELFRYDESLL